MTTPPERILVVDDEPNIALSLEFLLKSKGYEVAIAQTGSDALQQAATFRPQLVVLDVMLPVIDVPPPIIWTRFSNSGRHLLSMRMTDFKG